MAHPLPKDHVPLDDDTLDRFSVGPDHNLYLDGEKVVTFDLFESFRRAGWRVKAGALIAGLAAFFVAVATLVNFALQWNDRYCWAPRLLSLDTKCPQMNKGATTAADSRAVGKGDAVGDTPRGAPTEGRS